MRKLFAASLLAITPLLAEDCISSCECCPGPPNTSVSLHHRDPGGIGYNRGYSSIDLFYTPQIDCQKAPFIDLRGHVFNDGKPAFNLGVGYRYLSDCYDIVWGGNFYWDYRDANHRSFNQVGIGAEALGPRWGFQINGYLPIGKTRGGYRTGLDRFEGNSAYVFKKYELAMGGFDAGLGWYIFDDGCFWRTYTALRGYYLRANFGKDTGGGLFQLRQWLSPHLYLEGQISYDRLFKWIGQGEIALNFPLGSRVKRCERQTHCCPDIIALENRLVEKPERFEIIATTTKKQTSVARNAQTADPLDFIFVNNASDSDGTFESPFATLAGDLIYVFTGDGTTKEIDMGITLQANQKPVGSSALFNNTAATNPADSIPGIGASINNQVIANMIAEHNNVYSTTLPTSIANKENISSFRLIRNNTLTNTTTQPAIALNGIELITADSGIVFARLSKTPRTPQDIQLDAGSASFINEGRTSITGNISFVPFE